MRKLAICVLAGVCALVGCQLLPKAKDAARGPTFVVTTWDGEEHAGAVALADGSLTVGRKTVAREDVRLVLQRATAREAATRVKGFAPLGRRALRRYRERATAAAAKHRGVESVLCLDYGEDTLMADGKQLYRYHALVLVLKDEGRKIADLSLGFREGRSRRRVFFARSVGRDGRSRWLDTATMKVSTPSQGRQFLDTRRRVLSGRIPGVEVGSLVEFAYEYLNHSPEVRDHFFPSFRFAGEEPVLDSILDVRLPAGRRLNWTTRRMPAKAREPQRSTRDGYDVYRWELYDSPPVVSEPMMPDQGDVVPSVHCSLFFDWAPLQKRTGDYQRERIEVTPDIQKLATKIIGDAKTDDAKVAAIYHWVQRRINYVSIKGSLSSGWAGHPASETLKNGYGDCTDKAIVLASLCKAVGVKSYPVILKTNDSGTAITDIPVPHANHCISLVYPNGKPRFIDSTASNFRYPYFRSDDHGVKAKIAITGEMRDIPVPPPADNLRESVQQITLLPDGNGEATERNAYTGTYEARVRGFWRRVPPMLRARMMQQYLQRRSPGSLCTGFDLGKLDDLTQQLKMTIRYRVPRIATRTKDLYIVAPPGFARDFPEAALPTRQYAIQRSTSEEYRTTIQIACPKGYDLVGLPPPLTLHGKHLWYEGKVAASPDKRTLTLRATFKVLTRIVPPADYAAYRTHASQIAAWTRQKLVFRQTTKGRAAK